MHPRNLPFQPKLKPQRRRPVIRSGLPGWCLAKRCGAFRWLRAAYRPPRSRVSRLSPSAFSSLSLCLPRLSSIAPADPLLATSLCDAGEMPCSSVIRTRYRGCKPRPRRSPCPPNRGNSSWAFRAALDVHLGTYLVKPARYETKHPKISGCATVRGAGA